MMIKVFTTEKDGKITLTAKELKELLDEAYWEGYKANNHTWTYSTPSWSPYVYTTCNDGCTISSTIEANKIIGSSIDNNNITLNTATADLNTDLKFSTNWK